MPVLRHIMAPFLSLKRLARLARIGVFEIRYEMSLFSMHLLCPPPKKKQKDWIKDVSHITPDWLRYAYMTMSIDWFFPYNTHGEFHWLFFPFGVIVGILCPHRLFYDVTHAFGKAPQCTVRRYWDLIQPAEDSQHPPTEQEDWLASATLFRIYFSSEPDGWLLASEDDRFVKGIVDLRLLPVLFLHASDIHLVCAIRFLVELCNFE